MSLKVVHINREAVGIEAQAIALANILRPKWEAKAKEDAKKFFAKKGIVIPEEYLNQKA